MQLFGQEDETYCGEATAEMTRNGYPNPGDRVIYAQAYLYNIIQAKNTTQPGDQGKWGTDPSAMRECLQMLSSPPVNWVECAGTSSQKVQQFIMDCIQQGQFPVPVIVQEGGHWVLVVGWETKAASGGGPPVLVRMHCYDPEPLGHGHKSWVMAKKWNSADYFSKVADGKIWRNKFVAVGQRS